MNDKNKHKWMTNQHKGKKFRHINIQFMDKSNFEKQWFLIKLIILSGIDQSTCLQQRM